MKKRGVVKTQSCRLSIGDIMLEGDLAVPADAEGLVLFAHGSGSSRHSPRNRSVAEFFRSHGLATMLVDLLTAEEERVDLLTREFRFDIPRLAARLTGAIDWLRSHAETATLQIGCYGSSTGAAAALISASERPQAVRAVVSRGGRVDLAAAALKRVRAPTLMIVGELDLTVLELNRQAMAVMTCEKRLSIIPGATHLFEEQGALALVSRQACDWFVVHLAHHHEPQGA